MGQDGLFLVLGPVFSFWLDPGNTQRMNIRPKFPAEVINGSWLSCRANGSVTHSSNNRGIYAGGEVMKPVSVYDMCAAGIIMWHHGRYYVGTSAGYVTCSIMSAVPTFNCQRHHRLSLTVGGDYGRKGTFSYQHWCSGIIFVHTASLQHTPAPHPRLIRSLSLGVYANQKSFSLQ